MQVKDNRPKARQTVEIVQALELIAPVGGKSMRAVLETTIKGVDRLKIEPYTPRTQQGSEGGAQTP